MLREIPQPLFHFDECDVLPGMDSPQMVAELGRVGWDGEDDHADLGTTANDGTTLVKVQLYRGKDPLEELKEGAAQGYKLRARLSGWPIWAVPPKGTEVMLLFPGGFATTPGAGVIVACPGHNPNNQFSKTCLKIDAGPDQHLILKGKSVCLTMHSPTGSGPEPFVSISEDGGIQAVDADGNGWVIQNGEVSLFAADGGDTKTVVRLSKTGLDIAQKVSAVKTTLVTITNDVITLMGATFRALCGNVSLGTGPAGTPPPPLPVLRTGMVPSTSVFAA